jgi:hypothetical protein
LRIRAAAKYNGPFMPALECEVIGDAGPNQRGRYSAPQGG